MTFVDGTTIGLSVAAVERQSGNMLITSDDWAPHARDAGTSSSSSTLAPGVDEATGTALVSAVTGTSAPESMTRDQYLDFVGNEVDQS